MIPPSDYRKIIAAVPILCVDLVLRNRRGQFLLARRANEPLRGELWVIGGRVLQSERADDAARRKLRQELGIEDLSLTLVGVYEDFFERNAFDADTPYHTVSLVYAGVLDDDAAIRLDAQHTTWAFVDALPQRFVVKPFAEASGLAPAGGLE